MASDESTDILMQLVYKGIGVKAEAQSDTTQETLDHDTLMKGFKAGQFFEVDSVDLGFTTSDTTTQAGAQNKAIDGTPVRISRQIDAASPVLMQYCINAITLDSAAVVKRRAAGARASGLGYLRLDFTGVLITEVSWSDSHVVKETLTLFYRQVEISYRPQLENGKLGAVVPAKWALFS
jgi:type VI protein secretion system component Hcp